MEFGQCGTTGNLGQLTYYSDDSQLFHKLWPAEAEYELKFSKYS